MNLEKLLKKQLKGAIVSIGIILYIGLMIYGHAQYAQRMVASEVADGGRIGSIEGNEIPKMAAKMEPVGKAENMAAKLKLEKSSNLRISKPIYKHEAHIAKDCQAHFGKDRETIELCTKDVIAIVLQESLGGTVMTGDEVAKGHPESFGWYHIQALKKKPKVTIAQANDIIWSTDWVLDNMKRVGYPQNRTRAILNHNCPSCATDRNASKYRYVKEVLAKSALVQLSGHLIAKK